MNCFLFLAKKEGAMARGEPPRGRAGRDRGAVRGRDRGAVRGRGRARPWPAHAGSNGRAGCARGADPAGPDPGADRGYAVDRGRAAADRKCAGGAN